MKLSIVTKGYGQLLIKILISSGILFYLLNITPPENILTVLGSADVLLFTAGLITAIPINFLSAFQTHYLTKVQGMTISIVQIMKIHLITNYYGLFLPGILAGGAVKWYKFSKFGSRSSAAAVVLLNRFVETFVTVLLGVLFFIPSLYQDHNIYMLVFLTALFLLLFFIYLLLLNKRMNLLLIRTIYKYNVPKLMRNKLHSFLSAMNEFSTLTIKDHLEINGIVIIYNLIGVVSFYLFARAVNIELDILTLGWIRSVLAIVSILPFSFAGFGIREGSLVFLLGQYGTSPQQAIAFSILIFVRTMLNAMAGGVLEMLPSGKKYPSTVKPVNET